MPRDCAPISISFRARASRKASQPKRTGHARSTPGIGDERAPRRATRVSAPQISVVIPLVNERESLPELHRELCEALTKLGRTWEVIYIDDGSRDGSDQVIADLAAKDPRVRGVSFRRNFGKSAALATGFRLVRGEWVVTLDADLQDDPTELPKLIEALEAGSDLVSGWKQNRQDPLTKTMPSRLFNAVTSSVSGLKLHDFNCGFKLYRREVTDAPEAYGEPDRL